MSFVSRHIIFRIFAFLVALHILNISVDPLDPNPYWMNQNIPVDEMESITEIIFKKIFHIENAFIENKYDNNNKGSLLMQHLNLIFYYQSAATVISVLDSRPMYYNLDENFFEQHQKDILTPPPKA